MVLRRKQRKQRRESTTNFNCNRSIAADATGVKLTRYPTGLASALKKIKHESLTQEDKHRFPKAVAPLFISDPFKKKFINLFSTHPSIDDRISKLERM
ncbi:M48 family metalloprotease [Candidatus Pacearchaeota archaeon]|nr:M48 family metalloprotease [Candidatus Pacearchaeota archaeon]